MIGLYTYRTNNIGDGLQSIILAKFLDTETGSVWRDGAHSYQGPVTDLIVNGFVTKEALPISPKIRPIMLAVWLGAQRLENKEKVKYLRRFDRIGCRDTETLNRCRSLGFEAEFTGCPSILAEPIQEGIPGSVLLVDVDPRLFETQGAPHYEVQTALPSPVQWVTNIVSSQLSQARRWEECQRRIQWISQSETIVTSRIHIALPALGMGKAVIFVKDKITIAGRLTALPAAVRQWTQDECCKIKFEPDRHRYDVSDYKVRVKNRIQARCGHLLPKNQSV